MTPLRLDIEVPRNGHYFQLWQLLDVDHEPIDLTGHTLSMAARRIAGAGTTVASAILTIDDAANGTFHVKWTGADFDLVVGNTEIVRLAYDFRDTEPGGTTQVIARGHVVLFPEVTA